MPLFGASLTDDSRVVIYNRRMLIIQATDVVMLSVFVLNVVLLSCTFFKCHECFYAECRYAEWSHVMCLLVN
jgi:hypothetical protein